MKVLIYEGKESAEINCIAITKITEDHFGPLGTHKDGIFAALELDGSNPSLIPSPKTHPYKFEFVGDSVTTGFGDMSGTNIKCFFRMRHNQNCMESWAHYLAGRLDAEYRMIAESGKGVVKN